MRLLPEVHLVGSGALGFGMTDPHDSHVYLVADGGDAVLVDAGCGLQTAAIAARVAAAGVAPGTVSRILLTHAHADHAAGALGLAEALGARVCASEAVAAVLADGDEVASGLRDARAAGTYPPEVRLSPTPVEVLADGDELAVGSLVITVLETPGHADGHLVYLLHGPGGRAAFTGDLVFSRGRVAVLSTPDSRPVQIGESIRRLSRHDPDTLLPGHGSVVLSGAAEHLRTAVAAFDAGGLPPPLVT
ncbi:MAG: MBL fold metallo-hydrolase [Frankiales bacterium]|nr:MBL fold metallo-hydrolase [Frankiales bacterium]